MSNLFDYPQLVAYGMTVGVALAAPIGPINVEIIRRGLREGFWHGWMLGLGALTVDAVYALLAVTGFASIADHRVLRIALYLAGGVMLSWVGWQSVATALHGIDEVMDVPPRRRGASFLTGAAMAALNPMGIVYWLTVGAGLAADAVDRVGSGGAPILVVGVMLGIFCWITFLTVVAQISRRFVTGQGMRWITGLSGALVIGFGLWFLVRAVQTILAG